MLIPKTRGAARIALWCRDSHGTLVLTWTLVPRLTYTLASGLLLIGIEMAEKRTFERKKRRVLVDFDTANSRVSGFTADLSRSGMFISAARIPAIGEELTTRLHLPKGGDLTVTGRVVRSQHRPGALSRTAAHGFGVELSGFSEDYDQFCSAL